MKVHIIGFIAFLGCWTIGSAVIGIILPLIVGEWVDRFTGLIGFILGIVAWIYIVKRIKLNSPN